LPYFPSLWRDPCLRTFVVLAIALLPACETEAQPTIALQSDVRAVIGRGALPELHRPGFSVHAKPLDRFYAATADVPAWFERGHSRPAVATALAELRSAPEQGLAAGDYDVEWLAQEVRAIETGTATPARVARADVALTLTLFRYLSELHLGRVRPTDAEFRYAVAQREHALDATLSRALLQNQLAPVIAAAQPVFPMYTRLKALLARYRPLAAQPIADLPPLPAKAKRIKVGERYPGTPQLRQRLRLLGDLSTGSDDGDAELFSDAVVDALKRFQDRHGLNPDGVLGRDTLAQLNVPLAARVRQIELALERLRWIPALPPGPVVAVNIPSYRLLAFTDLPESDRVALRMRVIVGRAVRTPTPVFMGEMRYLEFSPYWNVPPSIQKNEIVPRLMRDPGYLAREAMELVSKRDASVTTALNAQTLAALRAGTLRVRQRPGVRNALGGVKFVLPNTMNIYLHSTPSPQLFEPARRDFSHGCIRVEDPVGLARFVLRDQAEWTEPRIREAMTSGTTRTVRLARDIPVVIFYTTVIVDSQGRASFLPDLYGYDRKLEQALRLRSAGAT
jgi:murein L,D-transpeptidase YcbB/YkuD